MSRHMIMNMTKGNVDGISMHKWKNGKQMPTKIYRNPSWSSIARFCSLTRKYESWANVYRAIKAYDTQISIWSDRPHH